MTGLLILVIAVCLCKGRNRARNGCAAPAEVAAGLEIDLAIGPGTIDDQVSGIAACAAGPGDCRSIVTGISAGQAQTEAMPPIDFLSCLVSDELTRRGERLLERRKKQAEFRDPLRSLDNFDFNFNRKMNRSLVFDLATGAFIARHEDGLFLGPPGTGKSHLAQAIGQAVIQQGYRVLYCETHKLLDDLAEATIDGTHKEHMELLVSVPLLIIDDLGMRKLPVTAAEELLEIVMRRYERASTLLTSNRPVEDWGKLLGDSAAVTAMLDRLLHHGHVLKCGPRSWRTKLDLPPQEAAG